ncbi:unnamed protein product [Brassica oleracea var. botrytis]|uniref:Uncharacterized protein n=1 Tax=Brassica oleracea TaxID=3712 RepID=A0A3P6FJ33_BRAOL|nr:unnamed protein product [Brassica oleracea]
MSECIINSEYRGTNNGLSMVSASLASYHLCHPHKHLVSYMRS